MAPLLPHLVEEVYFYQPLREGDGGLFRNGKLSSLPGYHTAEVVDVMAPALAIRGEINKLLGRTNSQEWDVQLLCSVQDFNALQKFQVEQTSLDSSLCELLQVASVTLNSHSATTTLAPAGDEDVTRDVGTTRITLSKTRMKLCSRCRRYTSIDGEICPSCSVHC